MTGIQTRFVDYLEGLASRGAAHDRAALAALRRGLGKEVGAAPEMFPYLVRWTADLREHEQEAYYLVASLFALHPDPWPRSEDGDRRDRWRRNFGASFRRVALADGGEVRGGSAERRFVALLNSDVDELPDRLRHAVSLCRSKEARIDWMILLDDLLRWDHPRRRAQRDWARAFWYESPPRETDADETEGTE